MRMFHLNRKKDVSGVSGTGVVARGVVFPSGKAVLEWTTDKKSLAIYDNLEQVKAIHGHGDATEVVVFE